MQICRHNGLLLAVLTRNEHCPPHVHVGCARWDARFLFSFWHNGVRLWDVTPAQNEPSSAVLEGLRQTIKRPEHLLRARVLWWNSRQNVCLDNQWWDIQAEEVITSGARRTSARAITAACFDAQRNVTTLTLAGEPHAVEIEL